MKNSSLPIRLLIADVDGTLVTRSKALTERTIQSVRKLGEAGILFAITSGRPPRGMSMLVDPLAMTTPIAGFNGGIFVNPDLTTIEEQSLPASVAAEVISTLLGRGVDVWVYRGADWLLRKDDAPHAAHEASTVRFAPTIVPTLEGLGEGVVKIVGVSDDLPLVATLETELRQQFGAKVSAARSQPYYLDVTHPNANKGAVVQRLSTRLKIPTSQIATIGDMPSDVLMFELSGLSIAMGNADSYVQKCATQVTTSNEEEGFANAVERYVLSA